MVIVGAAFLLFWLLIDVLDVVLPTAALVTAIVFIIAGLLLGERPWVRRV